MAITAFPFDTDDTTEEQFSRLMGEAVDTGILGDQGSTGFNVAPGSGMAITAGSPSGSVAIVRGVFAYTLGTEGPVAVANGHSTFTRIDMVVLRLDRAANTMTLAVVQGTASSTPVAPALQSSDIGTYEMPLAKLTIPPTVTTMQVGYITDLRQFIGTTTGVWTTFTRPTSPRKGKLGFNVTSSAWEWWTGSAWQNVIPDPVNSATRWVATGGTAYQLTVSQTTPSGTPTTDRIWIQPTA